MDSSEALVKKHLESRGYSELAFEPDGNIPPDFLLDGRIAIEVRRLNQNLPSEGKMIGLEESAYPLSGKIASMLRSLGPPRHGISWFVMHNFRRPIPAWSELAPQIIDCCMEVSEYTEISPETQFTAKISTHFGLSFLRASTMHDTMFLMGGYSDYDAGGFVLAEMERNIQHCLDEKTSKVHAHRHKYNEWWLALVDYIGYGLSAEDQVSFKQTNSLQHSWDKILIVSPTDPERGFEI